MIGFWMASEGAGEPFLLFEATCSRHHAEAEEGTILLVFFFFFFGLVWGGGAVKRRRAGIGFPGLSGASGDSPTEIDYRENDGARLASLSHQFGRDSDLPGGAPSRLDISLEEGAG